MIKQLYGNWHDHYLKPFSKVEFKLGFTVAWGSFFLFKLKKALQSLCWFYFEVQGRRTTYTKKERKEASSTTYIKEAVNIFIVYSCV